MGKAKATEKDVRYALEYGSDKLIRTIRNDGSGKFDYNLTPSNMSVTESIVHHLLNADFLEVADRGLFEGHPQSFRAKQHA